MPSDLNTPYGYAPTELRESRVSHAIAARCSLKARVFAPREDSLSTTSYILTNIISAETRVNMGILNVFIHKIATLNSELENPSEQKYLSPDRNVVSG